MISSVGIRSGEWQVPERRVEASVPIDQAISVRRCAPSMRWRAVALILFAGSIAMLTSCGSSSRVPSNGSTAGVESHLYISAGTERVVTWQWKLFPDQTVKGTIHAVAKIGATGPVDLGTETFVGRRQKIKITVDSICGGGIANVLDSADHRARAIRTESMRFLEAAVTSSGPTAHGGLCHAVPAGLVEGFLSQGDVAMTVILPVDVGCPNTFDAQDLIFVEGSASEFRDDVNKMTGFSGCPSTQPA